MPPSLPTIFPQGPPPFIHYIQECMACVVTTRAYALACPIAVEAGTELLDRALGFAHEWAAQ